ncbi:MAG: nickel pincer cofactor biosynthesis protein LarC [Candidatus Aminicenantes bacterium]|nr:MAG: nickel pincer cofactor biosynthesis protein LarC [Candidatus Aminicenantes bacterium]
MKYVYFDTSSGASGDMILGALLDLGIESAAFQKKMAELKLPVEITIKEVKRASLRGLKVDVEVKSKKNITRKWSDIQNIIKKSSISTDGKNRAKSIFKRLFEAEAHVHGRKFDETHLHEVGADDAIIDILGSSWLIEELGVRKFYASPLNLGGGWVKTSHGILPVPPPAVGELLKNIPVYSAHVAKELVTPTGAAILSAVVTEFLPFPELCYQKIGCGAGTNDFPAFPNILRIFYGETKDVDAGKKIHMIETNIDDENPQVLGHFLDLAMKLGALDVFFTPVFTKKNRPATKLTILAELGKIDALIRALFLETSTIGVRYFPVHRRVLERKMQKVQVLGTEIPVKVASLGENEINIQPEFSACQKAAKKANRPLREIMQLALREYEKTKN